MGYLSPKEIRKIGFGNVGKEIKISAKASFHNAKNISIGDYSRIDYFCVLSAGEGGIEIGNNVHIADFVSLIGKGKIKICDFANLSSRIAVYLSNDDYSGEFMTNPTVDEKFTNVTHESVHIGKHVIIGTGSIILPGVTIQDGASIGSLSLVKSNCKSFGIYAGIPAKFIRTRSSRILELEKDFMTKKKAQR